MISFDFRSKANGVPILSKENIEYIAERIIRDYKPENLKTPTALDVELFSECYAGLDVDYKDLSHNRSILGMIVFNDGCVPVYNPIKNKAEKLPVDEGTILIDNSLLEEDQIRRGRFTHCHEISHWFLHRDIYAVDKNQMSLFDYMGEEEKTTAIKCRTTDIESTGRKQLVTDDDWMEWQADYLASALLMPADAFTQAVRRYVRLLGVEEFFNRRGIDLYNDFWAEELSRGMARQFDVSLTAAKIRLKNLGFIKSVEEKRQCSII